MMRTFRGYSRRVPLQCTYINISGGARESVYTLESADTDLPCIQLQRLGADVVGFADH